MGSFLSQPPPPPALPPVSSYLLTFRFRISSWASDAGCNGTQSGGGGGESGRDRAQTRSGDQPEGKVADPFLFPTSSPGPYRRSFASSRR